MNKVLQDLAEKWEAEAKEYEGKGAQICAEMTRALAHELRSLDARVSENAVGEVSGHYAGALAFPTPAVEWYEIAGDLLVGTKLYPAPRVEVDEFMKIRALTAYRKAEMEKIGHQLTPCNGVRLEIMEAALTAALNPEADSHV